MPTNEQIRDRVKTLLRHRPSTIGNSIVMAILQFLSYIFGWAGIISSPFIIIQKPISESNTNQTLGITFLVGGILLLLVWKLTKMVRRRNAFILAVEEDKEDK